MEGLVLKRLVEYIIIDLIILTMNAVFYDKAFSSDTKEAFDRGLTEIEYYSSFSGIGNNKEEKIFSSEMLIALSFTNYLYSFFICSVESNEYFVNSSGLLKFGLFCTLVDMNYVDFDLFVDITAINEASDEVVITPACELNIDFGKNFYHTGVYFRAYELITGTEEEFDGDYRYLYVTELIYGAYYSIDKKTQILAEFDVTINHDTAVTRFGSLSMGFNYKILDDIELITEASVDILGHHVPDDNRENSFGITIGFIAIIPSGQ